MDIFVLVRFHSLLFLRKNIYYKWCEVISFYICNISCDSGHPFIRSSQRTHDIHIKIKAEWLPVNLSLPVKRHWSVACANVKPTLTPRQPNVSVVYWILWILPYKCKMNLFSKQKTRELLENGINWLTAFITISYLPTLNFILNCWVFWHTVYRKNIRPRFILDTQLLNSLRV